MNFKEFQDSCLRTETKIEQHVLIRLGLIKAVFKMFVLVGNIANHVKREIFYGKDLDQKAVYSLLLDIVHTTDEAYAGLQLQRSKLPCNFRLLHAVIGMAGESSELVNAFLDRLKAGSMAENIKTNFLEELGDTLWYTSLLYSELDSTEDEVRIKVLAKLKKRFPEGFSEEAAINRDTVAEMVAFSEATYQTADGTAGAIDERAPDPSPEPQEQLAVAAAPKATKSRKR